MKTRSIGISSQLDLALKLRDEAISKVASKNATYIKTMRGVARLIARRKGYVTADDLRPWEEKLNISPTHYNARGAVFSKCDDFKFIGYTKSIQPQGHGNLIRKWSLR